MILTTTLDREIARWRHIARSLSSVIWCLRAISPLLPGGFIEPALP